MILQGLVKYYERKSVDQESALAPFRWDDVQIPWLALFTEDGLFFGFQSTQEGSGSDRSFKRFRVPVLGEKKGNGIKANRFWENIEYMFGVPVPSPAKPNPDNERIAKQHQEFLTKLLEVNADSSGLKAIQRFFKSGDFSSVLTDAQWKDVLKDNRAILLAVVGKGPITDDPLVRAAVNLLAVDSTSGGVCMVSGKQSSIARLEPPIKGVRGSDGKAERALVSFNAPAYESFGKEKNLNSPMSEYVADAYAKALNHLMGRDSSNKVFVGDATTVFWSEKKTKLEEDFFYFWSVDKDNPNRDIQAVETLLNSPHTGTAISESDTPFFVLGLAPNSARIVVRLWQTGTVAEFSHKISQHFLDLAIIKPKGDRGSCALFFLLSDIALENKIDNIPPNLAANVMRAVLTGGAYPTTLLQQATRRIRATRNVKRTQAAILKACLNRQRRFQSNQREEEIQVSLDISNNNPGYRLGRLFAVLEKIQEDAQPGINATIRDRFYGAASSSPVSVFPQLLKLKNHHLAKLENPAFKAAHEKRLTEIFSGIAVDMPAHLSMDDQARFAIGYYHQRQALFTKTTHNDTITAEGLAK